MCTVPELIELDLKGVDTVAIDLETYDPGLKKHGSGAIRGEGFVCGIANSYKETNLLLSHRTCNDRQPRSEVYLELSQPKNIPK